MESLTEIANRLKCDKGTKHSARHGYTEYYGHLFAHLRTLPIRILEIGVGQGRSMRMWEEYFPEAQIFGFDISDCSAYASDRVTIFRGDQGNRNDWVRFLGTYGGKFEIVIDDGSHVTMDQLITFSEVLSFLRMDGFYCIEDLHAEQARETWPFFCGLSPLTYVFGWPTEQPKLMVLCMRSAF